MSACGDIPPGDEVSRMRSPGDLFDAVLLESNDGTGRRFWYDVHVVAKDGIPTGASAAYLYGAMRSVSAFGVNLKWDSPDMLAVEFLESLDISLPAPTVRTGGHNIGIILRPGVTDAKAPPGGMLYNLKGRPSQRP
jgi:hypothetical protein